MPPYVGVNRKIITWKFHQDSNTVNTLIHLLALSNDKETIFQGMRIGVGQVVMTKMELAQLVGLSYKQMRVCIERLEQCNIIRVNTNHHTTVFSVLQSDLYALVKRSKSGDPELEIADLIEDWANQKASQRANSRANKRANQKNSEKVELKEFEEQPNDEQGKPKGKQLGKQKDKPKGKPKSGEAPEYTLEFEDFWYQYPRQEGKKAAFAAWNKINPSGELRNLILSDIALRLKDGSWDLKRKTYIPHASTFLNGRRWEDEHINASAQESTNPKAYSNPFAELLYRMEDCTDESTGDSKVAGNNPGVLP